MVLGQDEELSDATRDAFERSGLAHVLAVSGQNVMLLATLVLAVGAVTGLGLRARLISALALVAFYVPLTGAGPSIQRAGVMGIAGLVIGVTAYIATDVASARRRSPRSCGSACSPPPSRRSRRRWPSRSTR